MRALRFESLDDCMKAMLTQLAHRRMESAWPFSGDRLLIDLREQAPAVEGPGPYRNSLRRRRWLLTGCI